MITTPSKLLARRVATLVGRNYAIPLGRAALGIKLLLEVWRVEGRRQQIALPSFLCQSPLAAVLSAGWDPVFCDIDISTANVSESEWDRVLALGADAILFVNLFGNVCPAQVIADKCKKMGVKFIEDIAQSLGGTIEGKYCGCHGDAAIVSFGHTKLIDTQAGGMLLLDDKELFNDLNVRVSLLPKEVLNRDDIAKKFTEAFFNARNGIVVDYHNAKKAFPKVMTIYNDLLYVSWDETKVRAIQEGLDALDTRVLNRRRKAQRYLDFLKDTPLIPIKQSDGSVPWRSVFRLNDITWKVQYEISNEIRKHNIDVSSWYIPSHWMINCDVSQEAHLKNTEKLSQEIFQFWVDENTSLSRVEETASVVRMVMQDAGYV